MANENGPSRTAPASDQLAVVGAAGGGMGAAVAAAFAGLCCIGPAGVALLGVGERWQQPASSRIDRFSFWYHSHCSPLPSARHTVGG